MPSCAGNARPDVAAGAGGQGLAAARGVGPDRPRARDRHLPGHPGFAAGVAARVRGVDGGDLEADGEDLCARRLLRRRISRVGLIYFPDQHRALPRSIGSCEREAIFAVVYSTPTATALRSRSASSAGSPAPAAGSRQLGPFSLGARVSPSVLHGGRALDITVNAVPSPVRLSSAASASASNRSSFGALHRAARLHHAGRAAAWQEITDQLTQFETPPASPAPAKCSQYRHLVDHARRKSSRGELLAFELLHGCDQLRSCLPGVLLQDRGVRLLTGVVLARSV